MNHEPTCLERDERYGHYCTLEAHAEGFHVCDCGVRWLPGEDEELIYDPIEEEVSA